MAGCLASAREWYFTSPIKSVCFTLQRFNNFKQYIYTLGHNKEMTDDHKKEVTITSS